MLTVDTEEITYSTAEAVDLSGVTNRQLLHWTATGLIRTVSGESTGTGTPHRFSVAEVVIAGRTGDLLRAGMELRPAVELARRWQSDPGPERDALIAVNEQFVLIDVDRLAAISNANPLSVPTTALMDHVVVRLADIGIALEVAE